jgi:hypothetical protein
MIIMASHNYHEGLPGYADAQIFHDGCGECEARAEWPDHGLSTLDRGRFVLAWRRAAEWHQQGAAGLAVSHAEAPLLGMLWAVQVKLEQFGIAPGVLPGPGVVSRSPLH